MKKINLYTLSNVALVAMTLVFASCGNTSQSPGVEYMPDMYRTPALEPYSGNSNYADSMEARKPAAGTIARGYLPYGMPNTFEGYEAAGELLRNPLANDENVLAEGKVIYTKYCLHCHGKEGAGDGLTVTAGGHPPPPAYNSAALKTLPEGKMFHTITYGKNLMGSHSSQLNVEERWKVIRYVQTLQNPEGEAEAPAAEGVAEDAAMSDETAMNN
jgi:mono/diheme cytochrome c family protein